MPVVLQHVPLHLNSKSGIYPEHLYQVVRVSERFLSHDHLYYHLVDRYWDQELTWIIQRQVRV